MKNNYHLVPRESGWAVIREGAERASGLFDTKQEGFERGRGLAQTSKGELIIHSKKGPIHGSNSYGHDPFPPKG